MIGKVAKIKNTLHKMLKRKNLCFSNLENDISKNGNKFKAVVLN